MAAAPSFAGAERVFLEAEAYSAKLETMLTVANIRHDIDTRDAFYDAEAAFIDAASPELEEYTNAWDRGPARLALPRGSSSAGTTGSCSSTPKSDCAPSRRR